MEFHTHDNFFVNYMNKRKHSSSNKDYLPQVYIKHHS